jgi:hypothetical protein
MQYIGQYLVNNKHTYFKHSSMKQTNNNENSLAIAIVNLVPDPMAYEFYECLFSSKTPLST